MSRFLMLVFVTFILLVVPVASKTVVESGCTGTRGDYRCMDAIWQGGYCITSLRLAGDVTQWTVGRPRGDSILVHASDGYDSTVARSDLDSPMLQKVGVAFELATLAAGGVALFYRRRPTERRRLAGIAVWAVWGVLAIAFLAGVYWHAGHWNGTESGDLRPGPGLVLLGIAALHGIPYIRTPSQEGGLPTLPSIVK